MVSSSVAFQYDQGSWYDMSGIMDYEIRGKEESAHNLKGGRRKPALPKKHHIFSDLFRFPLTKAIFTIPSRILVTFALFCKCFNSNKMDVKLTPE